MSGREKGGTSWVTHSTGYVIHRLDPGDDRSLEVITPLSR